MPQRPSQTLAEQLASPKLASVLLVGFILLSALGTIIPQEALYPREEFLGWQTSAPLFSRLAISLGLTDLYASPVYIIVAWLLMLSVALCTWRRFLAALRRGRQAFPATDVLCRLKDVYSFNSMLSPPELLQQLGSVSLGGRWKLTRPNDEGKFAFKFEHGRGGLWGSLIFHFSLLLILAGSLASTWTRVEGTVLLTEGERFDGHSGAYFQPSDPGRHFPEPPAFQLTLQKVRPSQSEKTGPFSDVLITGADGRALPRSIGNFHALSHRGYTFYQKEQGHSPALLLKNSRDETLFDGFVAFQTLGDEETKRSTDAFIIPATGLRLEGTLVPEGDNKSPVLNLQLIEGGRAIYQGALALHQSAKIPGGELTFSGLRRWASFRVVHDRGVPILYAGFFLGVAGLCLRVLFRREEVWGVIEEGEGESVLTLAGRTEGERALFSERFEHLCQKIETHLITS